MEIGLPSGLERSAGSGVWLILRPRTFQVIIGLSLLSYALFIEHEVETLVMQRVVGIALGYEDLIDNNELRHDPVLATLAGKLTADAATVRRWRANRR